VSLAAVFCHGGTYSDPLKASKTSPGQKREEGQGYYTCYPQAMSLMPFHDSLRILLNRSRAPVNSLFSFFKFLNNKDVSSRY
jgi:hypothetical protein